MEIPTTENGIFISRYVRGGYQYDADTKAYSDSTIEAVIKNSPGVIRNIRNPKKEWLIRAMQTNGLALEHIAYAERTKELCEIAAQQNMAAAKFIPAEFKAEIVQKYAEDSIVRDPKSIRFIDEQTERMALMAVRLDPTLIDAIHDQTERVCAVVLQQDPKLFSKIRAPTEAIIHFAMRQDPTQLKNVRNQTEAACVEAVSKCGMSLIWVETQTKRIVKAALDQNPDAIVHVTDFTMVGRVEQKRESVSDLEPEIDPDMPELLAPAPSPVAQPRIVYEKYTYCCGCAVVRKYEVN